MRDIYIYGDIVDRETDKISPEDVCPLDIISQITDDDLTIHINSCGGSVSAGLAIASVIQSAKGHTTAIVDGVAASIASVIAFAADDLVMHPSSYLMIHRVWGEVVGNCEDLRKEADTMEQLTKSLIKIYRHKMDLSEDEIDRLLADETWISGEQLDEYRIKAICDDADVVRYAAKIRDKHFNKLPICMEEKTEEKKVEEVEETKTDTTVAEVVEEEKTVEETDTVTEEKEEKTEEVAEEKTVEDIEELKKEIEKLKIENQDLKTQLDACKTDDVEKRVSGMQSKMQNKINDITKDFKDKLDKTSKELDSYKNECISLKSQIEDTNNHCAELEQDLSAVRGELDRKSQAMDQLTSRALTAPKDIEVNWRDLKGKEFFDHLKRHPELIK